MRLPILTEIQSMRDMIDVFKGYNNNLRIGEGEFHDMENLTSDDFPVVSPRKHRGTYVINGTDEDGNEVISLPTFPEGLIQKDALCYVACQATTDADGNVIPSRHKRGAFFYINDKKVEGLYLSSLEEDCPKQLISMGNYVIIMPDKKWVKTISTGAEGEELYGNIEATVTTKSTVSFEMCRVDGKSYTRKLNDGAEEEIEIKVSASEPEDPENLDMWIDTSSTPHTLKQYAESSAMWVSLATSYIKISATGIGKPFKENDGVTISGITNTQLSDLNSTMIVWARGDDYIVVTGILNEVTSQDTAIKVERKMPNMDFVIESENRLWGCRYGVAANGEVVNEIYASKLGDFKNWNCYMGISTDSYAATVGTDGQFTGAVAHLGHPIFFKENCMHKVYGNFPANYQITTTTCRGVQKGSHKSLAIVNEILYYKSRNAICAYDGSLPQEISYNLGNATYSNAVACSHGNKYYISMENDATGEWNFFVYDASMGLWHKEENTRVYDFCSCRGELYFIDHTNMKNIRIRTVFGSGLQDTGKIKWMAETGHIGTDSPDQKYISRLNVRMNIELNTNVFIYVQYDSTGDWELIYRAAGIKLQSFTVPIRPRRCDHLKLRFVGEGRAKIYSISKTIEQGSDVV